MQQNELRSVILRSWNKIHSFQKSGWIYRGQQFYKWGLKTSLERCCERERIKPKDRNFIEKELLRNFRRAYHQYAQHIPDADSTVEWLSLMQHHGAPTRLLDFDYSIYIAEYFALENADSDCAVWAVNLWWAVRQSKKLLLRVEGKKESAQRMVEFTQESHEKDYNNLLFEKPFVRVAF